MFSEMFATLRDLINTVTTVTTVNEEEIKMNNKVLELYYNRETERIEKVRKEEIEKIKNSDKYIEEYNTLVEGFKTSLAELTDRANRESLYKVFTYNCFELAVPYVVDPEYMDNLLESTKRKYDNDLKALTDLCKEIEAVLSISDDKDYQLQVLKTYGILDKNGVMK